MIPLGTDRPLARRTVVNHALIVANVTVFCLVAAAGIRSQRGVEGIEHVLERWMLVGNAAEPWRFVTYAFLHDMTSLWHLLGNMVFLWVLGPNVEDRLGRTGYLAFYLAAAAASGLGHVLVSPAPAIGASGAVAAVTGAYLVLFPRTKVKVLFIFFLIAVIQVSAMWFVSLQVVLNLLGFFTRSNSGVAYGAHLAGYAFGVGVPIALLAFKVLPSEPYDLLHLFRHARRKAEIREAVSSARSPTKRAADRKPPDPTEQVQAPVAEARARVARLLADGQAGEAMDAYRSLVEKYGLVAGAATMSRRLQLDLANHFFQSGDHGHAFAAYDRFITTYPRDPETPHVRLMLAMISGRYLHQFARGISLAKEALDSMRDEDQRAIAMELVREFEAASAKAPPGSRPAGV